MKIEPRWRSAVLLCSILLLPLIANRDAYRGYFEEDDLDTLAWARFVPFHSYLPQFPWIVYPAGRPTGYLYYWALNRTAGLNYAPWVVALQLIGVINVLLLWLLMRKAGLGEAAAAAGCLFSFPAAPCSTPGGRRGLSTTCSVPRSRLRACWRMRIGSGC